MPEMAEIGISGLLDAEFDKPEAPERTYVVYSKVGDTNKFCMFVAVYE